MYGVGGLNISGQKTIALNIEQSLIPTLRFKDIYKNDILMLSINDSKKNKQFSSVL